MPLKLPLRRSPVFLLGCFPLVILLWGWADSDRNFTRVIRCRQPNSLTGVQLRASSLWIVVDYIDLKEAPDGLTRWQGISTGPSLPPPSVIYTDTGPWGRWLRTGFHHTDPFGAPGPVPAFRDRCFPAPAYTRYPEQPLPRPSYPGRHRHTLKLPFWLLVLACLPPRLGLAWWQARRIRLRLAATDADLEKASD
jgi:hypothetical protein